MLSFVCLLICLPVPGTLTTHCLMAADGMADTCQRKHACSHICKCMSMPRHTLATWRRPYDFSEEGGGTVPWMQGNPRVLGKDEDATGSSERAALGERKEKMEEEAGKEVVMLESLLPQRLGT